MIAEREQRRRWRNRGGRGGEHRRMRKGKQRRRLGEESRGDEKG